MVVIPTCAYEVHVAAYQMSYYTCLWSSAVGYCGTVQEWLPSPPPLLPAVLQFRPIALLPLHPYLTVVPCAKPIVSVHCQVAMLMCCSNDVGVAEL